MAEAKEPTASVTPSPTKTLTPSLGTMAPPPPPRPSTTTAAPSPDKPRNPPFSSSSSSNSNSSMSTARKPNRQSVSFPIAISIPPTTDPSSKHRASPSLTGFASSASASPRQSRFHDSAAAPYSPSFPPSRQQQQQQPVLTSAAAFAHDTAELLGQLAACERRVMELREELAKADRELEATKRRWILHEAHRKRSEGRAVRGGGGGASAQKLVQLRPKVGVMTGVGGRLTAGGGEESMDRWGTDERPNSALTKLELLAQSPGPGSNHGGGDSSLTAGSHQTAGRGRVLSGQRHIRPLSLLGPGEYDPGSISTQLSPDSVPSPLGRKGTLARSSLDALALRPSNSYVPPTPIRNGSRSRSPDVSRSASAMAAGRSESRGAGSGEGGAKGMTGPNLARTGRKIARDFQDGLWTFIGDLKQATISNEPARSGSPAGGGGGGGTGAGGVHDHLASPVS